MKRNYIWKEVIRGEKVVLAKSYISYGISSNYHPSVSKTTSFLYKGLKSTLRTHMNFTETSTHINTFYSLNLHEAFA